MNFRLLILLLVLALNVNNVSGQQKFVNHLATFSSGKQNMWGPSFSPVTLDQTITLFDESWNVNWNTGTSGIFTVAGLDFGGAFSGSFSGRIGSDIRIEGFTSGTVEVDYPVDIELSMPDDLTYDQGDFVSIGTDYTVESGWVLETLYPSAGEFFWDVYFQMAAEASAQLCFFGCTTFPIIPAFNTGLQTINIVTISTSGASTNGNNGVWFLGPAISDPGLILLSQGPAAPPAPEGLWPYSLPFSSNPTGDIWVDWIPWQVYSGPILPYSIPDTDFGLTGEISVPYVVTDSTLNVVDGSLNACGDSTYFNLNLEIFKVLGFALSEALPPPYDAIGEAFSNMSGSESLGLAEIWWNFFSASFDANITNKQCFNFNPKIYGRFEFPVPVDYSITDLTGTTSAVSQSSIINFELGDTINYKFPCYYEKMNITPTYSIDGVFRNHTYDEVTFDFLMSAFEFGFTVPPVIVIPGFTIPEICIPIPYPCPSWSNPFAWCTYTACTPELVVPSIGFDGWSESVGPLWETTIPLGSFSYDWFDQTWSLEGFKDTTFVPFFMEAKKLTVNPLVVDVDCHDGSNGSVLVSVNAVSDALPYSYNWTNGTSNAAGANADSIINLEAGEYQVQVSDNNGCQLFTGGTVKEPRPLSVTYTKTNKSCAGGALDGAIDVSVSGGNSPYTYAWSGASTATSQDLTNLDIGNYTLTVTDSKNCQEIISVAIDEPFLLTHTAVVSDINCNSGSDGAIDVTTRGGVLPYSFSWSSSETTEDLSNIPAGNYTITIEDNNSCISTGTYSVVEPAQPLSVIYTSNDVSCYSGNNGDIDLTVNGGTPNYNYEWFSDVSGLLSFSGEDPTGLVAGTYTVNISDQNDCSISEVITISEPAAPISDSELITDVNCFGDLTGAINPQISGGTLPYTYLWSDFSNNSVLSNVAAGTYTLTVTDFNGCTEFFEYIINQPESPLSINVSKKDVNCFGEATGSIEATVRGGTAAYSYSWSNGETTQNINNLSAGSYTLTVTDDLGCTEFSTTIIDEPAAPLALSSTVSDVLCYDGEDGSIDLTVTGGTTPYSYLWSDGGTYIYDDTTQDLSNLSSDHYLVLVEDANNCTDTLTSMISQPLAPISTTANITNIDCFSAAVGAIDVSVTGGSPNYFYSWSTGETSEDLINITSGTYILDVTDQNGCLENYTFIVNQPEAALMVTTNKKNIKCNGSATGSIETTVKGGTKPYMFNWSTGQTSKSINNLAAGSYSVTVTDNNGCTAISGSTVIEPAELVVDINITDPSCYGYSNGQVTLDVTGGVQPYYFDWGDQNSILINNEGETIDSIETGEYFIRVKDENNCIFEELVFVDQPAPFEYEYSVEDVTCFDGDNGAIDLTLSGGTTPYNIDWSNGLNGPSIEGLVSGNYAFTGLDDQGCLIRGDIFVDEPEQIKVSYDLQPVSCIDQSDAAIYISPFGGTTPYSYSWSNNVFTQNNENLAPGFYELTITDDYSCTNTFGFDILMNNEECLGIPNTFTPNDDNYNDTWVIENIELYPNSTVKIFNKWGNEIFSAEGTYDPWDGTHKGEALPAGVYYYIIILSNDQDNKYTGNLTIVR